MAYGHARDSQRERVYNFDDRVKTVAKDNALMPLEDIKGLVTKLSQDWGVTPPEVRDGRRRQTAGGCSYYITLPRNQRDKVTVLHELAHSFTDKKMSQAAWHGAEFMRVYLDLLAKCKVAPLSTLRTLARESGVRVATIAAAPKFTGWQAKFAAELDLMVQKRMSGYRLTKQQVKRELEKYTEKM